MTRVEFGYFFLFAARTVERAKRNGENDNGADEAGTLGQMVINRVAGNTRAANGSTGTMRREESSAVLFNGRKRVG